MQTERQIPTAHRHQEPSRRDWVQPQVTRLSAGSAEGVVPGAAPPDFSQAPS